jgi:hypothetical protein
MALGISWNGKLLIDVGRDRMDAVAALRFA